MTDNRKIAQLRSEISILDAERREILLKLKGFGMLAILGVLGLFVGAFLLTTRIALLGGMFIALGLVGVLIQYVQRYQRRKRIVQIDELIQQMDQEIAAEMGLSRAES